MKNVYKFIGIILSLLLFVTGCGYEPKLSNGQELVAEFNNATITADNLYEKLKNNFARDILIEMIDTVILNEKYEVNDEMNRIVDNQIEFVKTQTKENFLIAIRDYFNVNSEEELRQMLILEQQRIKAANDYVKTLITDKEINEYYNEEIVGDIKVSHILIKPDVTANMTDSEKEAKENEALVLAKGIINRLNNGETFNDLAKQYSADKANSNSGGDLGYFNKGKMTESFERAAFALKKGSYSTTPVETEFGYHIILKTDEKAKPELKLVRNDIIDSLVEKRLTNNPKLRITAMIELRKTNNVKIHDTELKRQYDDYMQELLNAQDAQ